MDDPSNHPGPTRQIAQWVSAPAKDPPSERALTCARHALLDWVGVTLVAARGDLANKLVEDALKNGETGSAGLVGRSERLSSSFAALTNGAVSHVLDYDDINKRMRGHPTVTIMPAILAAAASNRHTYGDVLDALVVGTEVAGSVGEMMGAHHYERGFHTTATIGTIAAAAAVSRLLRLSETQTENAIGLAATQAAGLRSMFGTMGKPIHAGKAAMNGLLAARWSSNDLMGQDGVLERPQGFGVVLSNDFSVREIREDTSHPFGIEQNIYKYHAACYYTHSAIEALSQLVRHHAIKTENIDSIRVGLLPSLHSVCDIREPSTGLEVKFSIRHLLAMVLIGVDTSDIDQYTDEMATRNQLVDLRSMIDVFGMDFESRTSSRIELKLKDGTQLTNELDVGVPMTDLSEQERRLSAKFHSLVDPVTGAHTASSLKDSILSVRESEQASAIIDQFYTEPVR